MLIVAAGARRDLGQLEAAVLALQVKELTPRPAPAVDRATAVRVRRRAARGRSRGRGATWFERAVEADPDGETDAAERLAELDGFVFEDAVDED